MVVSDVHVHCKHSVVDADDESPAFAVTRFPFRVNGKQEDRRHQRLDGKVTTSATTTKDDDGDSDVIVIRHSLRTTLDKVWLSQ